MNKQLFYEGTDEVRLKTFIQEFFPFKEFLKIGFFKKEMKDDYYAQAEKICVYFSLSSIYEYDAVEIRSHLSKTKK